MTKGVHAVGVSLRQRISELGWDNHLLGSDGYYARLGTQNGRTCFVPFGRFSRWFSNRALPIEEIIPLGSKVKFLQSLRHDIVGEPNFLSFSWFLVRFMSVFAAADLSKMALFEGFMDGRGNSKPFSQFPFDKYLIVRSVRQYEALYEESDGTVWTIDHNALTTVTQIEIDG